MKRPDWFTKWIENDYSHLMKDVTGIKHDMWWVKVLGTGILVSIIGAALAIVIKGG